MIEDLAFNFFLDFLMIGIPIAWLWHRKGNKKEAVQGLGLLPINGFALVKKSLKLFILLIAVSLWLSLILQFLGLNDLYLVAESFAGARAIIPILFGIIVVGNIAEEIFFRGFLVRKTGVLFSSALFALFHASYGSIAEVLGAFALGLILAKAFQLNKNLYPNILAHIAYNSIAIFVLL